MNIPTLKIIIGYFDLGTSYRAQQGPLKIGYSFPQQLIGRNQFVQRRGKQTTQRQ